MWGLYRRRRAGPAAAAIAVAAIAILGSVAASYDFDASVSQNDRVPDQVSSTTYSDVTLFDASRTRQLPLRVHYPGQGGPCPVIVFSHGAGGSREVAPALLSYWATSGYVVIAPSHADSVELQRSKGNAVTMNSVLRDLAKAEAQLDRVMDARLILDSLEEIERMVPQLAGRLDRARAGIGGHSAGAMTSMLLAGARPLADRGALSSLAAVDLGHSHLGCALILSGRGVGGSIGEESFAAINMPMMVMTGSLDRSEKTHQTPQSRQEPFDFASPGSKYLLFIEGAAHTSFTGRTAGREQGLRSRWVENFLGGPDSAHISSYDQKEIFSWIQKASLAFWDAHLRSDAEALKYLQGQGIAELGAGGITYRRK